MANTVELTSGQVMDRAAVLMNDSAKSTYSYAVQVPYLNMALQDLQEHYEQNEMPITSITDPVVITIPAGTTSVTYGDSPTTPRLPDDMIEPSVLWERQSGVNPFTLMTRVDFLDQSLIGQTITQFIWYTWEDNSLNFFAASQNNDLQLTYIRNLFALVPSGSTGTEILAVQNAIGYLSNRTARHLSFYIAENPERAKALDVDAQGSLDRLLGIGTKGRQAIVTRRRPFRAAYKRGSYL